MDGPIEVDDVFKDLRPVLAQLDPSADLLHIGISMREKARQRVQQGIHSGVLTSWADVHDLIQEQDDEDLPLEEGQEAFDILVGDDDDEDEDDSDGDDDEGDSGSGAARGSKPPNHEPPTHDDAHIPDPDGEIHLFSDDPPAPHEPQEDLLGDICDLAGVEASGQALVSLAVLATEGSQPNASSSSSSSLAPPGSSDAASSIQMAREVLHREALRNRDDHFARTLRKQMAGENRKRKAADVPEAAVLRDV